MHYKLASLISTSQQKTGVTSEVFISQPDANKESLAGRLFMIAEIDSNKAIALKIINFLIDTLNHNYYQNEKIILRERLSTLKIEHIFETALAKINKDLIEFLKNEKIKITPNVLNITVGVIYENNLHFSVIGKNKALLIYREKENEKTSPKKKNELESTGPKYKVADVGKSEYEEKKPKELTKIFSDVISGHIPQKGYFLFTNEALPEYLTNKQLIEIVTKLPPVSAAEQIKKTLEKVNAYISFAGVIIKNTTGLPQTQTRKEDVIREEKENEDSLESLNVTEQTTEKLLSPSGSIDFKKITQITTTFFSKIKSGSQKVNRKAFTLKDKIFVKKQKNRIGIQKILDPIKNFFIHIVNIFVWLYKTLTNKDKLQATSQRIKATPMRAREKSQKGLNWFKALNKRNKILFGLACGFIILFIVSLSVTSYLNHREVKQELFDTLISKIEQKQNQVEANLLYSNKEGAKKLLDENSDLLYQLSQKVKENDENLIKFSQKHEEQLEKIRHFVIIENPKEIANFTNLNSQANALNITFGENKIYSGDLSQKTIYSIDLADNLVTAIADLNINFEELAYPVVNKDKNAYFMNNNSIIELNTENNEIKKIGLTLPGSRQDIISATGYNNRLYLLDNKNNQIYRMIKDDETGFTKRDPWLQTDADLSQSTDLAIDGNIYVLNKNGTISKFLSGQTEDLIIDQVEPVLTDANRILVTDDEDGYIYVLESSTNRLVVFDKDGDFILQYRSDKLQNIKDFAVNKEAKKVYFLNNNSVYEIDGEHFE